MGEHKLSDNSKTVAKGSAMSLAGNLLFNLISFLYVVLIARAVSPDDLGLFYLALSVVSIAQAFEGLGMAGSLSRYVPFFEGRGEAGKIKALLKSGYKVVAVSSFAMLALCWLLAEPLGAVFGKEQLPEAIRLLSLFLPMNILFRMNQAFLRGRVDIRAFESIKNLQHLLKLALTLLSFQLLGASVLSLIIGFVLSMLLGMLVSFIFVRLRSNDLPEKEEPIPLKQITNEILPFGFMLTLMTSVGALVFAVDRVLLGYFLASQDSTAMIAVYSIAVSLAMVAMIFSNSIGSIFLPLMSRLFGGRRFPEMLDVTETAQRWSLFMTVPPATVMIAFAPEMLSAFYGESYAGGALVLAIVVLAVLIRSMSSVLSLVLSSMRVVKLQLRVLVLSGLLNVALNILLIPLMGITGPALAFLASSIATAFMLRDYARKLIGFRFSAQFKRLLLVTVATLVLVLLLKPYFLKMAVSLPDPGDDMLAIYAAKLFYLSFLGLLAALSFMLFMGLVLALKCFGSEDLGLMRKAMAKARMPKPLISLATAVAAHGLPD